MSTTGSRKRTKEYIVFGALITILVFATLFSIQSIQLLQGHGRTINFAGIIRGGTQRLVVQELMGDANDGLLGRLDRIIVELRTGQGDYGLMLFDDAEFQGNMTVVSNYWANLTNLIHQVRAGADPHEMYELSQTYFVLADNAVAAAESYSQRQVANIIVQLVLINGFFLALFVAVLLYYLKRIATPLSALSQHLAVIETGQLVNDIAVKGTPEINTLASAINSVSATIQSIVQDLSDVWENYNVQGQSTYRIDESKYQNAFKDMMGKVNANFDAEYANINDIVNTLGKISEGDFDVAVTQRPGDGQIQSEAIQAVLTNLKGISAEINGMIYAFADQGDLRFTTNSSDYQGEWQTIMKGLDHVAEAVYLPLQVIEISLQELRQGNTDLSKIDDTIRSRNLPAESHHYAGMFREIIETKEETLVQISGYVTELETNLLRISQGDMTCNIARAYQGDFDTIRTSVNTITSTLRKTLGDISAASQQVSAAASSVSGSSLDVAAGSQQQSTSLEQLSQTITVIEAQAATNADSAEEANVVSQKSNVFASKGNAAMEQMLEAMEGIKVASSNISNVIKVIQDIAFQTNLLALNASVEAARAGEHGKGFSVVAEEVRALAGRSQKAAEETTSLIEDAVNQVDKGSDIAKTTAEALHAIVSNADQVLGIIDQISVASKEQAQTLNQMGTGMTGIAAVVQNNMAVSEESAAAAEELNSQAETLQQLVSYFKVNA